MYMTYDIIVGVILTNANVICAFSISVVPKTIVLAAEKTIFHSYQQHS
jgi:hypothetical protein